MSRRWEVRNRQFSLAHIQITFWSHFRPWGHQVFAPCRVIVDTSDALVLSSLCPSSIIVYVISWAIQLMSSPLLVLWQHVLHDWQRTLMTVTCCFVGEAGLRRVQMSVRIEVPRLQHALRPSALW